MISVLFLPYDEYDFRTVLQPSQLIFSLQKWRPINYSFVCMLISPLCLIFISKFFCFFFLYMLTRLRGLINMQTKE